MTQASIPAGAARPRLVKAIPAQLDTFEECSRRHRLARLTRPAPAEGPRQTAAAVGVAVHGALSAALDPRRGPPTPAGAVEHLALGWPEHGWRDPEQSGAWYRRFQAWTWTYAAKHFGPGLVTFGVERPVAAIAAEFGIAMEGRVDRVDDRRGQLVAVDYKTGRLAPGERDARSSRTLAVYAACVWKMTCRPCLTVELHHVPSGTVVAATHTAETLRRHLSRAADTARDIQTSTIALAAGAAPDEAFPPRPGAGCSYCPYRGLCPEGRAAAPDVPPWASLDRWEADLAAAGAA